MYKIEKGIDMPNESLLYPFSRMEVYDSFFEVYDSFFIPKEKIKKVRSAAASYSKTHGVGFKIWQFGEGYRCWRVK